MNENESIAAARRTPLDLYDAAGDEYSGAAPAGAEVQISICGAAFTQAAGSVVKIRTGDFYYEATQAETRRRGPRILRVAKAGMRTDVFEWYVGPRTDRDPDERTRRIPVYLEDDAGDPVTGIELTGSEIEVSVNGGAFVAGEGVAGEIGFGAYYYEPTKDEHARGSSLVNVSDAAAVEYKYEILVDPASFPVISNATTEDLIRDRAAALVKAIVPEYLPGDRFQEHRYEDDGDIIAWCEANPATVNRRFMIRYDGVGETPAVSNGDHEERTVMLTTIVAYGHTARTGKKEAVDRDRAISRDRDALHKAIGMYSRRNFTSPHPDASWKSGGFQRVPGEKWDFLVVNGLFTFRRAL